MYGWLSGCGWPAGGGRRRCWRKGGRGSGSAGRLHRWKGGLEEENVFINGIMREEGV